MEAYDSVSIRDWWVAFERDEGRQQWRVDLKVHCETPDVAIDHAGTVTVTVSDGDTIIQTYQQPTLLIGDVHRQVSTQLLNFTVPFSRVIKPHLNS